MRKSIIIFDFVKKDLKDFTPSRWDTYPQLPKTLPTLCSWEATPR